MAPAGLEGFYEIYFTVDDKKTWFKSILRMFFDSEQKIKELYPTFGYSSTTIYVGFVFFGEHDFKKVVFASIKVYFSRTHETIFSFFSSHISSGKHSSQQ